MKLNLRKCGVEIREDTANVLTVDCNFCLTIFSQFRCTQETLTVLQVIAKELPPIGSQKHTMAPVMLMKLLFGRTPTNI